MAIAITKQGAHDEAYKIEFVADTAADVADLPTNPDVAFGSTCLISATSQVFILSPNNTWKEL